MKPISRTGDIAVGVCYGHPIPIPWVGVVSRGATRTQTNNRDTATRTKMVHGCHVAMIIQGNNTVITEYLATSRVGHMVKALPVGILVTGSKDTRTV